MDAVSRASIHQTRLLLIDEISRMKPGCKRQQLEAALVHMRRDVLAMRRSSTRPQRTQRAARV
eukprot:2054390-Rhodomonas_salina.1